MKRIDKRTERKLFWLFTPLIIVLIIELVYAIWDINILQMIFGLDIDILDWINPAIIISASIIFVGYSIAAIKQKCWGELALAAVVAIVLATQMTQTLADLIVK